MAYSDLSMDFGVTAVAKMLLPGDVVRNALNKENRFMKTFVQGISFGDRQLIGICDSRVPKIPKGAIAIESGNDSAPSSAKR